MKSLSADIVSGMEKEKLKERYPTLTDDLINRYRLELDNIMDHPTMPDADIYHYIGNLDRTYNPNGDN